MRLPEVHVYSSHGGVRVSSVVLRNEDGSENDLSAWRVSRVKRDVIMGEVSTVQVTFFARLVEHDESEASAA